MTIELIERLIESNECLGKPAQFKARIQEPDAPEFYYRQTVDGLKYGPLGTFEHQGLWYAIHVRSGRSLGLPLSSEESARRLVFLLRDVTKWSKVNWKDDRAYESDELFWLCVTASEYCNDLDGDYDQLVLHLQKDFAGEGSEEVLFAEPVEVEIDVVEFGMLVTI